MMKRNTLLLAMFALPGWIWGQVLNPEKLPHQGEVFFSKSFEDGTGSNVVFASAVDHNDKESTDLFVYQYRLVDGSAQLIWDIQDFGGNLCDMVLHEESVQILDLDGDKENEVSFIYQQRCDGLDPYATKLMLHSKGKKYAIRGKIAVEDAKPLEKTVDVSLNEAPVAFKRFANQEWDEFVEYEMPAFRKSVYDSGKGWVVVANEDLRASGGISFSILDQTGKLPQVPAEVKSALGYATDVSVMPDKNALLILSVKHGLICYQVETGKYSTWMTFLGDTEALSNIEWSPSKKRISFVALNQAQYPYKTKVFVLDINGYQMTAKEKYDARVYYMAASDWVVVTADFTDENTLKYYSKTREGDEGPEETLQVK